METTSSRVLADVEITGSLKFTGGLLFEGKFHNGLIEGDRLVVSEGAQIHGDIVVNDLTSLGRIDGDVAVLERCQLQPSAELHGKLKTARLAMEEGATFCGDIRISQLRGEDA